MPELFYLTLNILTSVVYLPISFYRIRFRYN